MSTLSGLASKGEKPKVKFQCLDINNLYRVSRGESLEKQQQKNTLIKHGMQSLGKVPNARRAPKNLPSMKLEHSGTDTAIALVPQGGSGWGKQETTSTSTVSTTTSTTTTSSNSQGAGQLSSHQAAIALPVTTTIPPQNKHVMPAGTDKSWSAITSGSDSLHPPPYQSPQFQHEFPSLFSGEGGGAPARTNTEPTYTPGLSLRPQTEGSWIQGGSRLGGDAAQRSSNLAPLGAPPQLSAPVGLSQEQQPFPAQFRGVMPPFMYKGNFAPNSSGGTQSPNTPSLNGRSRPPDSRPLPPRLAADTDEVTHRPIIKEEDLSRMDEISKDVGWASHEDIDYNQKLSFSDDESVADKNSSRRENKMVNMHKENEKVENQNHLSDNQSKSWNVSKSNDNFLRNRSAEEDELWVQQRRNQNSKEIDLAVQRAKQRREEEEKRFSESTKQGAAKKLQELEEKKMKREREEAMQGTINPSAVPPKPVTPVSVPLPDFQRDRERDRDSRSRTPNEKPPSSESNEEKSASQSFRHLTQIEGKNLIRNNKHPKERDIRDRDGPGSGSSFTKFDMPPRFLKQQQRNSNMHFSHQYDRWMPNNQGANKPASCVAPASSRLNPESSDMHDTEDNRKDYRRQNSDDTYKASHRSPSDMPHKLSESRSLDHHDDYHHHDYDTVNREKEEDKWQRERDRLDKKIDQKPEQVGEFQVRQSSEEWHPERRDKVRDDKYPEKYERPQRPDSRDSRASRDSRHSRDSARDSEPREYLWTEATFESNYEEKKRDNKEDRRVVPGPITKDRIEADDIKNEKRKLTQLKRGQITDKKVSDVKRDDKIQEKPEYSEEEDKKLGEGPAESKSWTDAVSLSAMEAENTRFSEETDKGKLASIETKSADLDNKKSAEPEPKERDDKRNNSGRNRPYLQSKKGWGGNNEYHRSGWTKRPNMRDLRPNAPPRTQAGCSEIHGTDSEASTEDQITNDQRSPKPMRKSEKDEKNRDVKQDNKYPPSDKRNEKHHKRDNYVPRGEPSRHGRGGGNFRSRGSMSKRIDGYGPPPTKSPFGHPDEKDKKLPEDLPPSESTSSEDKTKQSQQALSIGIIGAARKDPIQPQYEKDRKFNENSRLKSKKPNENRHGKSRNKGDNKKDEDNCDTSDNSDENMKDKSAKRNPNKPGSSFLRGSSNMGLSRHNPPRMNNEKRMYGQPKNEENLPRQNSNGALRSQPSIKKDKAEETTLCNAIADISLKNKEDPDVSEDCEEKSLPPDSDGFQEVKSKKNVKEKQKPDEKVTKPPIKVEKEVKQERNKPKTIAPTSQLTQQQISNIPPLMSTPVNPPQILPPSSTKVPFDRPRNKLAPRFAKQRENNRLQKVQMQQQQQHSFGEVSELNKVNQSLNVYKMKDSTVTSISNAWDKPLSSQLRGNMEPDNMLSVAMDKNLEHRQSPNQSGSPSNDKVMPKTNQLQDTTLLDGTTPPVNTIIFENTNYKSTPVPCNARPEKPRPKLEEAGIDTNVMPGFNKPMVDLMNKNEKPGDSSMQLPISFKEDNMKLDFFDPDLSHLSDEKISKNICLPRSMHAITSGNSTISTAESLNFKIQSVKKVWETTPSDHNVVQEENNSFTATFVTDTNSLDPNAFNKSSDAPEDNHEGYSPSPNQTVTNSTTNVCKVKPTQQVSGNSGQTVLSSNSHQQHLGTVTPGLMAHPLSPPPMQPVLGANVGIGQPPQQYTANQHLSYQASLSGNTQYNMSAIPSPPTVLYNSTQQIQQQTAGLYGPFQIDQASVLGGQGRSQYSQYPNHYSLGQTASSPYSAQSVYLPTAQPHPPPAAQAPPDLYPNISNYRLSTTAQFGQNQQLNNPTTVLISSTSNSLMSASVKPSSQQMSAIGTKSGGVGQAYQQQSQGQQVYMAYDPSMQANYLPSAGVMQRAPTGPVQNNVVPALQPSSSYYSGSTGGQTGYFQQPASSTLQSAQLTQHQAGYGLQGNMFGTPSQSHTNAGLQSFNSHFSMQIAAAINAQQYRSGLPTPYIKSVGSQSISDQTGRPQQLKSPSSQEVLSSVFNSGSQIPSPKSRQNCKQPPPQPSPTGKHNYNLYQGVGSQQTGNVQRYPAPIQRPVSFQQNMGSSQQNSSNQKHRAANTGNKAPPRQYYSNQTNPLSSQGDKSDEGKIVDSVNGSGISCSVNSTVDKAAIVGNPGSGENPASDQAKEKEASTLKD